MKSKSPVEAALGVFAIPDIGEIPVYLYLDAIQCPSLVMGDSTKDYVYILLRADNVDDGADVLRPFYVGKGIDRRYAFHYSESVATAAYSGKRNNLKANIINKVGRDNVRFQMVPCPSPEYSKALEIKLIAHWGRRDNKSGILSNLTDGGEGVAGLKMPEHVLELLREKARQPVRFNGVQFSGIKVAFQAHTPEEISRALQVDANSGYCRSYEVFKAWYSGWAKQGFFPVGFNYLAEGKPVYAEVERDVIQEQVRVSRAAGYLKAWDTRYPYPRYLVNGNRYHTFSEAARVEAVGTPSNLAARFRRMMVANIFNIGFNVLDEKGERLYEESEEGLLEISRKNSAGFLAALTSKPLLVNGFFYPNRLEAYNKSSYMKDVTYESFSSQINRYEKAGVFPVGLNIPSEDGTPLYPEVDPAVLKGGDLSLYYKVCGRFFPSMQSASLYYGLSHSHIHRLFDGWIKQAEDKCQPLSFPSGFNIYDTVTGDALYPEMTIVDPRVPVSGYLYLGKKFKKLQDIDDFRGSSRRTTSALYVKKRRSYFESYRPFDAGYNVLGLDGLPLYPVNLSSSLSTPIARADGNGHRLHNVAKPVWIRCGDHWERFDSKTAAYRALPLLQKKYKSADSFISSLYAQEKSGKKPDWLSYVEPLE